jgi:hypothetical protein
MIVSEIVAQRRRSNVDRHPPLATIVSMPRPVGSSKSAKTGNSLQSRAALESSQPCNLARGAEQLDQYRALRSI